MAGYAVECLLKTKLMRIFRCQNLPQLDEKLQSRKILSFRSTVFTHQLETLLKLAKGLDRVRNNRHLWQNYYIVNRWIPAWRYTADLSSKEDAQDFLEAVDKILHWLENNI